MTTKQTRTPAAKLQQLTEKLKDQAAGSKERMAVLANLGFNQDFEPTAEELAKKSIHALTIAIDCIVSALLMGEVVFKTAEGAVASLVSASKLRSELVAQAGLNGQGITENDLGDEEERLRKATGEIIRFTKHKSTSNKRKVSY